MLQDSVEFSTARTVLPVYLGTHVATAPFVLTCHAYVSNTHPFQAYSQKAYICVRAVDTYDTIPLHIHFRS